MSEILKIKIALALVLLFSLVLGVGYYSSFFFEKQEVLTPLSEENSPFDLLREKNDEPSNSSYIKGLSEVRQDLVSAGVDFLEINLDQMKVKAYSKGSIIETAPVLTKGDPEQWGGTPSGLYQVGYKNRASFSAISKVYMPYSLHFYGKYFLHGQPYYPGGRKLDSSVSGGCIRLMDNDARKIYNITSPNTLVLVINKEKEDFDLNYKEEPPKVSADSYLVADLDSGFVFAEKNAEEKFPIASLTKLMTATVVTENLDLRKSVTIRKKMLEPYGSTEKIEEGNTFRIVELLYPLLIESSNDVAEALSYALGKQRTIDLMNEKAESILMKNTKFTDPSGFDSGNVSTAEDLFHLARHIYYSRPPIFKITRAEEVRSFGIISFEFKKLWNKNVFIYDPTFVGGKTGYTPQANHTALFVFKLQDKEGEERKIVFILLNSQNEELDTQKLYIWLKDLLESYNGQ